MGVDDALRISRIHRKPPEIVEGRLQIMTPDCSGTEAQSG